MHTLVAHHETAHSHQSALLSGCPQDRERLMEPAGPLVDRRGEHGRFMKTMLDTTTVSSTVYNGHLGVLRQENPTLERQRRYDFWFKRA